ncbi:phage regulatory CII family protein [Schaalia sp. lx-100]|uniref:phage regulatory CII family protein n=1 Tax=Schaalia sp. lx-100 TaxID=2899081 RepID=UPI001E29C9FF|nr:phage regulatory CII family protein [Schaalia sp. lx-100]MCD4557639.1 hypothetical protein [Schaalia sp. lx-100]
MDIKDWFQETVKSESINAIARKAGINQVTLNRQVNEDRLSAETIAAIARAYKKSVLDALVIQGLLKEADLVSFVRSVEVQKLTDEELVAEIMRRLKECPTAETAFDEPFRDVR